MLFAEVATHLMLVIYDNINVDPKYKFLSNLKPTDFTFRDVIH